MRTEVVRFDWTSQQTRRLSEYRVPRLNDIPEIEVDLIDRRDIPAAGARESAITLTAAAIANAVFAATGQRFTSLPFHLRPLGM
jgi:isoquinoline 1-oxidoreductase